MNGEWISDEKIMNKFTWTKLGTIECMNEWTDSWMNDEWMDPCMINCCQIIRMNVIKKRATNQRMKD